MSELSIEAKSLSKHYGHLVAVDELEMQLASQLPADGGLPGAHRTHEKQVLRIPHDILLQLVQTESQPGGWLSMNCSSL